MADIRLFLGSTPDSAELDSLRALLSDDERARIDRIRLDHVRERQVAAQSGLRVILGRALGLAPEAIRFRRGPHGKPHLEDCPLSFNLTRSEDRFAVGIADTGALGVDIEFGRPIPRLSQLVETVFTETETAELAEHGEAGRLPAFYRGWTRKEAFMKAVGMGLHLPLRSFSVSLREGRGNALASLDEPARRAAAEAGSEAAEWWVTSVTGGLPPDLYAAAAWDRGEPTVAVEAFDW